MSTPTLTSVSSGYTVDVLMGDGTTSPVARAAAKIRKVLVALITGLLLVVTGFLTVAQPAQANFASDAFTGVFCSTVYSNATPDEKSLVPSTAGAAYNAAGQLRQGHGLTAYEKYGMSGLAWTTWIGPDTPEALKEKDSISGKKLQELAGGSDNDGGLGSWGGTPEKQDVFYNKNEACGDFINSSSSQAANMMMAVSGLVVHVAGVLYQLAVESSSSLVNDLGPTIEVVVGHLVDSLYLEFFSAVVMLAALWLGYQGLVKRRTSEFMSGVLWTFGSAVIGMFIVYNPMMVPNTVNNVVGSVTQGVVSTIASPTTVGGGTEDGLCTVDAATSTSPDKGETETNNTAMRSNVRAVQCSLWSTFQFNTWVQGQFGHAIGDTTGTGADYITGEYGVLAPETPVLEDAEIPEKISFGDREVESNWALLQLDSKVRTDSSDETFQGRQMLHVASAQTFRDDPNRAWAGSTSINRVMLAIISLIGALGISVMIIIITLEMVVLEIGLVILVLLAPLFALAGVHPGMGRRIALMWVNTIVELALRRIVLSLLLSVMILLYGAVVIASAVTPWIITIVLVVAVAIAGITYKNKLTSMFGSAVNLGGAGKMNLGDSVVDDAMLNGLKGLKAAGRVTTGAIGGGLTGAAMATKDVAMDAIKDATAGGPAGDGAPRPMSKVQEIAAATSALTGAPAPAPTTLAATRAERETTGVRVGTGVATGKVTDSEIAEAAKRENLEDLRPTSAAAAGVAAAAEGRGGVVGGVAAARAAARRNEISQEMAQQDREKHARHFRRADERARAFANRQWITDNVSSNPDYKVDLRPVAAPDFQALAEARVGIKEKNPNAKAGAVTGALAGARSRSNKEAMVRSAAAVRAERARVAKANAFRAKEIQREIDHLKAMHEKNEAFKVATIQRKAEAAAKAKEKAAAEKVKAEARTAKAAEQAAEAAKKAEAKAKWNAWNDESKRKVAAEKAAAAKKAEAERIRREMMHYTPRAAAERRRKEYEATPEGRAEVRWQKLVQEGPEAAAQRTAEARLDVQRAKEMADLQRKAVEKVTAQAQAAADAEAAAAQVAEARKEATRMQAAYRRNEKKLEALAEQERAIVLIHQDNPRRADEDD